MIDYSSNINGRWVWISVSQPLPDSEERCTFQQADSALAHLGQSDLGGRPAVSHSHQNTNSSFFRPQTQETWLGGRRNAGEFVNQKRRGSQCEPSSRALRGKRLPEVKFSRQLSTRWRITFSGTNLCWSESPRKRATEKAIGREDCCHGTFFKASGNNSRQLALISSAPSRGRHSEWIHIRQMRLALESCVRSSS